MSRNFFIHVRIIFGGNFPGVISGSFFLRQTRCKGLAEELLPLGRRGLLLFYFNFGTKLKFLPILFVILPKIP